MYFARTFIESVVDVASQFAETVAPNDRYNQLVIHMMRQESFAERTVRVFPDPE